MDTKITLSLEQFANTLDRVVSEQTLRNQLEHDPIGTLNLLGIELNPEMAAWMKGKRFSEALTELLPPSTPRSVLMTTIAGTLAATGASVLIDTMVPDKIRVKRSWSAAERADLVEGILRGKTTVEAAASLYGLDVAEVQQWVDKARVGMEQALSNE